MASNKLGELRPPDLWVTLQVTQRLLEIKALNPLRGGSGRQCMIIAIIWLSPAQADHLWYFCSCSIHSFKAELLSSH